MKTRIPFGGIALLALLSAACSDAGRPTSAPLVVDGRVPVFAASRPTGGSKDVLPTGKGLDVATDPAPPARTRNRIEYHAGGPVLPDVNRVYFIWYGAWPSVATADTVKAKYQEIVVNFAPYLCDVPYTDILRAYTGTDGRAPRGCLGYGGSSVDAFSHGPSLSDADVADIVLTQVATGQLPYDPNGFYVMMASPEIAETSGFGTDYCGWHGRTTWYDLLLHFGYMGYPGRAPTSCAPNGVGPNGHASGDAAVSHLAALWADIVTDPNYDAWYDKLGLEVADKCVWTYGTTYTAANGKLANVKLGSRDYLLQQLWVPNKSGGACALHP